ncbi:thyroid hormone receptor-associated protein 3 isoform X2 [Trichomycterus rosablanca]|uniref:thyroid hormone receptor-associated protein 3 isoform X2 n=1 Tax=Trichomycterus rosablanca TaxID=2290929 RepID=UPI002F35E493
MSKTARSSRTHSRSRSRSRSRTETRSRSRSRSSSRSRSRKHRYGSRSRSRSRSHSPFHNRGRQHQREYQNNREFRGYHRGFRRPYFFRGRGRGFFRGRFQRGGGGGYNNYRSNNWQNFRQHSYQRQKQQQQHEQQQHHGHSPKRGRSRTPKKRSSSPLSLNQSHHSDRSSSLHSQHSSSSNSSRLRSGSCKQNCKAVSEALSAPIESQTGGDITVSEQGGCPPDLERSTSKDKDTEAWHFTMNHESPNNASPQVEKAFPATSENSPVDEKLGTTSNGMTSWQTASMISTNSTVKKSPTPAFSGFGLFTNDNQKEDPVAISMAFKKFLEEQKNKKQAVADKVLEKPTDNGNVLLEKIHSKSEGIPNESTVPGLSRPAGDINKKETEKTKFVGSFKYDKASSRSLNRPPFVCEDTEEEMVPHLQMGVDASKHLSKVPLSARKLFEEHIRKLEDRAWDDELEAFLISREKERAARILAALSQREKLACKFGDLSPERPSKIKRIEQPSPSASTYAAFYRRKSECQEPEFVMNLRDTSPPRPIGKRETEFNLRVNSLSDDLARSSVLSDDWRKAIDLVHSDKKDQDFHLVFQQLRCKNLNRSPSELFAQHIVSIVHDVTAEHFPSSGITLNDRFAMYQRLAAEKEIRKPRKSPEIHRRIDVSPSDFKRHSFLFEDLKSFMDGSSKGQGRKFHGDTAELQMDIEQHKKYLSRETNDKQERRGISEELRETSQERASEKSTKYYKKYKKSKKKQKHSQSSSSSSSAHEEEDESTGKSFSKVLRECVGPAEQGLARGGFFKIRGRGWNRVNFLENNKNTNSSENEQGLSKIDEWDQEHMAESKKYCLLNKNDETQEHGQTGIPRVKGRFILRRPTSSSTTNNSSSNWSHDTFQASSKDSRPGNGDQKEQNST